MCRCMRSIFWIGCTLSILFTVLVSGAVAEQVTNASQGTTLPSAGSNVSVNAENVSVSVTDNAVNTTKATNVTVSNLTAGKTSVNATVPATNVTIPSAAGKQDALNGTLIPFVKNAAVYAQTNGKDAALSAFSDRNSNFAKDGVIIFAYDYDGKALALPYEPNQVGNNRIALSDSTGFRFVQQMRDLAKTGKGVVKYQYQNPMNKNKVEDITSYVSDVDGTYWVGAGMFIKDEPKEIKVTNTTVKVANATTNSTRISKQHG